MDTLLVLLEIIAAFSIYFLLPGIVIYTVVFRHKLSADYVWGIGICIILGLLTEIVFGSLLIFLFGKSEIWIIPFSFLLIALVSTIIRLRNSSFVQIHNIFHKIYITSLYSIAIFFLLLLGYSIGYYSNINSTTKSSPTEFYILGDNDKIKSDLVSDSTSYVNLGIISREEDVTDFFIKVYIDNLELVTIGPIQLSPNQVWETEFTLPEIAYRKLAHRLSFNLLVNDKVYRKLFLNLQSN